MRYILLVMPLALLLTVSGLRQREPSGPGPGPGAQLVLHGLTTLSTAPSAHLGKRVLW